MDIHVYRLTKCGFYSRGEEEPKFGNIEEWWEQFVDWVEAKEDVSLTATFDRPEEVPRRLYCADAVRDGAGNFGVALWNESPMYQELNIAYLPSAGKVGEVQARTTRFPTGSIAGWPSYIWFLPRRSLIVAFSPENFGGYRGSGIKQAREYFRSYLESRSSYVRCRLPVEGQTESHETIDGYSSPYDGKVYSGVRPRLETTPFYGPGPLQEIVSRCGEIRKIVKSYTVDVSLPDHRRWIERALDFVLVQPENGYRHEGHDRVDRRNFKVEATWHPNKNDLVREIEEWETQDYVDNYWVGVFFEGENKIRRFDKEQGKMSVELNGDLVNRPLWTGEDLIQAWTAARGEVENFLRLVEDEQEAS